MRTAGVVAFLLAVVLDANALDWKWIEHAYPEDGFRVEFNAPVTIKRMRLTSKSSERVVRATRYMLDEGKRLYLVAASLNKDGVDLEEGVRRSFAGLECGVLLSDEPVAAPWGMGRALQARHCVDGTYRAQARYHRSGRWFYQVVALYKEAGGDVESARYFLDSFRVTR
jgi:hypothetical protein